MPIETLHAHRRAILELATRHGARNLRVFGSIAPSIITSKPSRWTNVAALASGTRLRVELADRTRIAGARVGLS